MKRTMYSLTYCYEATDGNAPYAATIAVSEDIDKLVAEMNKCVEQDCQIDEEDEWNDECNFKIYREINAYGVCLQHTRNINLYATYGIHVVEVL